MPTTKHGGIQTDRNDQRKFITLQVLGPQGDKVYRKVYLQTKEMKPARARATALEGITDPATARKIITYIAAAKSPTEEQSRIAEYAERGPLIPACSFEYAGHELKNLLDGFTEQEPDAELIRHWRKASLAKDWRSLLLRIEESESGRLILGKSEDGKVVPRNYLDENPDIWSTILPRGKRGNPNHPDQNEVLAAIMGIPVEKLPPDKPARGPRLSECLPEFLKTQEGRVTQQKYRNAQVKIFKSFVDLLKDKRISGLEKDDFIRFKDKILEEKKGKTNQTINRQFKVIRSVLRSARTRMPDETFPDGLDHWIEAFETSRRKYKPKASNRQPMPPDVFQSILKQADGWADMDWQEYGDKMPIPENPIGGKKLANSRNRRRAKQIKRDGLLGHLGFCLAVNCGTTAIDLCRLLWSELDLTGKLPLFKQPRTKTETNEDMIIPVMCPLLPETIRSIKRWKEYQDAEGGHEYVFTTEHTEAYDQEEGSKVTNLLGRIRAGAKVTAWEARHCRNVGETVRRDERLPEDMGTAWLRHSEGGTNVFYRGTAKADYLSPLVSAIGKCYFAGPA